VTDERGLTRGEELALLRTRLSIERTVLSYVRTALSLGAAGLGLVFLLDGLLTDVAGWFLVAVGIVVLVVGTLRSARSRRSLDE
jgi:uncharacterized membrane protein YidH (DUF202 family)